MRTGVLYEHVDERVEMAVDKRVMHDVDVARTELTDEPMTIAAALIGGDGPVGTGDHSAVIGAHLNSSLNMPSILYEIKTPLRKCEWLQSLNAVQPLAKLRISRT